MSNYTKQLGEVMVKLATPGQPDYFHSMGEGARAVHDSAGQAVNSVTHGIGRAAGNTVRGVHNWWDDLRGGLGAVGNFFGDVGKGISNTYHDAVKGWGMMGHDLAHGASNAANSIGNSIANNTYRPIFRGISEGYNQAQMPSSPMPMPQVNRAVQGMYNRTNQQLATQVPQIKPLEAPSIYKNNGLYGSLNPYVPQYNDMNNNVGNHGTGAY